MDYAERSYFDGYAFAHIAAWQDVQRLARIKRECDRRANRR